MQFPILDHYIHTRRHRKPKIRSKCTFFCVCLYECNDPEWKTAYEQAPKTGLKKTISQERQRERERKLHNVQFLGESHEFPLQRLHGPVLRSIIRDPCAGQYQ